MSLHIVGGIPYPCEKWWSSSVGMMKFPTEWKNNPHVPNHQPVIHGYTCHKMGCKVRQLFSLRQKYTNLQQLGLRWLAFVAFLSLSIYNHPVFASSMFQPVSWPNMQFYRHILEPTKWGPPVVFVSLHIHQTIVIITIGPTEPSLFNSPIFGTPHLKNCASRSSWETCEKPPKRVASDNIL